jgi:hypothetical protein
MKMLAASFVFLWLRSQSASVLCPTRSPQQPIDGAARDQVAQAGFFAGIPRETLVFAAIGSRGRASRQSGFQEIALLGRCADD